MSRTNVLATPHCPTCGGEWTFISESSGNFSTAEEQWSAKYYVCLICGASIERIWLGSPVAEYAEEFTEGKTTLEEVLLCALTAK